MWKQTVKSGSRLQGFTLIELLVAISLMALMAVLGWRGLDGIGRAQQHLQQHADDVLTLQSTLSQWGTDLDAMTAQGEIPGIDWDGRTLRLLRHSTTDAGGALVVVAWARRSSADQGHLLRWQSAAVTTRGELDQAWQKAALWAQTPSADDHWREVRTVAIDQWQIFYYRQNAWSNPLSSADSSAPAGSANPAGAATARPDAVRLVLTLSTGQALQGTLTRDWLQPVQGGGK